MKASYSPYEVAHALALYSYNCAPAEWVEAIYPGRHPDYIAEKVRVATFGFWHFYGVLDLNNKAKLVDAALGIYGVEAKRRDALRDPTVEYGYAKP